NGQILPYGRGLCAYYIYIQPFTCSVVPVIYPACGLARKATAVAISAAAPRRPRGICDKMEAVCDSFKARVMSVSMKPGATQLTVMLRLPNSRARARAMPATPALAAA